MGGQQRQKGQQHGRQGKEMTELLKLTCMDNALNSCTSTITIEILVSKNDIITLPLPLNSTISCIKFKIFQKTGIPIHQQVLRIVIPSPDHTSTLTHVGNVVRHGTTVQEAYCLQRKKEKICFSEIKEEEKVEKKIKENKKQTEKKGCPNANNVYHTC